MATNKGKQPPKEIRGVPLSDYRAYARDVRRGKTTWEKLERAGLVKPNTRHTEAYHKLQKLYKAEAKRGAR